MARPAGTRRLWEARQTSVLALQDVSVVTLAFVDAAALCRLACCSHLVRVTADADPIWRSACVRFWEDKQHTLYMRRWLAGERPSGSGGPRPAPGPELGGPTSWKERYAFALRDRHRCRIFREELCEDAAVDPSTGRPWPRRWHLLVHFDRWQDKELVFRPSPGEPPQGFHFSTFQDNVYAEVPWEEARPLEDEVEDTTDDAAAAPGAMALIGIPSVRFPLRPGRRSDWGWTLRPAVSAAEPEEDEELLLIASRQLSAAAHQRAGTFSPELFTLCLEPVRRCLPYGPSGTWEVALAFQGTLTAGTWVGTQISFEFLDELHGMCGMAFPSDERLHPPTLLHFPFFCEAGASAKSEGHIDLHMESSVLLGRWSRGPPAAHSSAPLALVVNFASFFGHEPMTRPASLPTGLPGLCEAWEVLGAVSVRPPRADMLGASEREGYGMTDGSEGEPDFESEEPWSDPESLPAEDGASGELHPGNEEDPTLEQPEDAAAGAAGARAAEREPRRGAAR